MTRESVQFTTEGVLLHLPKSKTDQFRQGHTIPLAFSGDSTCPVKALQIRDGLGRNFFAQARPVRPKTGTTEHDRSRVSRARALPDELSVVLGRAFL